MRHGKKNNHLGRTSSHRKAMLANMASSLIKHKRIITTVAKAKTLRIYIEPLITKSKDATTHNYRTVFAYLKDKEAVTELFTVVSGKVASRPGGYTRILKTGNRAGDNADMAMIELVDFNEFFDGFNADKKKTTTRRSRRSGAATSTTAAAPKATAKVEAAEEIQDAVVVEETPATPIAEAPENNDAPESNDAPENNDDADNNDSAESTEEKN
jgi:large subunit ribosomal protein L17